MSTSLSVEAFGTRGGRLPRSRDGTLPSPPIQEGRRLHAPPADQITPRPAATVVLVRDGSDGLEVLLTHRPSSMVFAPDMHVFPGGAVDPADVDPRLVARSAVTPEAAAAALGGDLPPAQALATFVAAIRESFEEAGVLLADGADRRALEVARAELLHVPGSFPPMVEALDLRLRTDLLVPISRWVTPVGLPRRFDARFFAATVPEGAEATLLGDEVAAHAWHTPRAALDEMAAGRLGMWLPTSTTLQQLEFATSIEDIRARSASGLLGAIVVEDVVPDVIRVEMPAGGGVAGQPVNAYLVGSSAVVLVDPGDPTGPAVDRAVEVAAARGGAIIGIALTHTDPDHAAGAEAVAEALDVPVYVGPGGGRDLPYRVIEVGDGAVIEAGATALRVIGTPGPRPDHVAFLVEDAVGRPVAVLSGDLDGVRGARCIPRPVDDGAWAGSVARLRSAAADVPWLPGHGPPR
jgi:glyoxylase-like metal-dependent hydrolase (beta-lactamase superfamily II)/8-oxo-dGTP pyrophosphatase MutT (NUDIX family)